VWRWDYLERNWLPLSSRNVYPGQLILARADVGGYSTRQGFDLSYKKKVMCVAKEVPVPPDIAADAAQDDESLSEMSRWQTIAGHGRCTADFLKSTGLVPPEAAAALETAALWHDLGKAHPAFVSLIKPDKDHPGGDIAKAPPEAWIKPPKYRLSATDLRPGFRHELASVLALLDLLQQCSPFHEALLGPWQVYMDAAQASLSGSSGNTTPIQKYLKGLTSDELNLLLYLVAAHHGKVRGNMQASPADQSHPVVKAGDAMPIRGIFENDIIPSIHLSMLDGSDVEIPATRLTLELSAMGLSEKTGASWAERCAGLLDKHGPFTLAWFETLIRAADALASK
jgi:CRISPR-associated endonuclease/helicase Cas3